MLLMFLACGGPTCEPRDCPAGRGGEYCCEQQEAGGERCWWRAGGHDFDYESSFTEYCQSTRGLPPGTVFLPEPRLITCNDGTRSPTCTSCDAGCCSDHGGCL